jgi:two-component system, chemotaxis family, sensor kinase CheA
MDPILQKFKPLFIEEASGLLDQLEKDLLDLESSPTDQELIESAFRAMHTIKGVSGMYGFDYVAEFTHQLESLYQSIRDRILHFSKDISEITFLSVDHIRKLLNDESLTVPENIINQKEILRTIETILCKIDKNSDRPSVAEKIESIQKPSTWQIIIQANEQIYFRGISITSIFHDLAFLGQFEITKVNCQGKEGMDIWSVILYSDAKASDIREVFMFIEDDCTITRLTERNLFDPGTSKSAPNEEQSILDYVEMQENNHKENLHNPKEDLNKEQPDKAGNSKKAQKGLSVDSVKLDQLIYLVSELITLNSQFNLATSDNSFEAIWPFTERLDNLSKLFRNNALDIRLVPLNESILRLKRLIRDLSRQLGKDIELVTEGTETEVDKSTIDQLNDPLMHIIRNCIDHGIELPQVRQKNGKSGTGVIKITASNSGNKIIIRIEDDGAGIDIDSIRSKAIEKGIIKPNDKPSRQELLEMIFLPGFSTAASLTEVSGRGVGMDVVRRKITELRGEVHVESRTGEGCSFTLKLQQSIAIIDTLLFQVEDTFFTIPITDINVCMEVSLEEINKRRHTGNIPFENQLIPIIDLRNKFGLGGNYNELARAIVLRNNEKQLALLTDTIIGGHQAVLKSLGNFFRNQKCIGAASQLGDGKLAFMLDTSELFLSIESF